jgi:hypothetical protein
MAKSSEAKKRVLEESFRRRNSSATALILRFLGLSSMRSVTNARDGTVFFGSAAKDPDLTKQKVMIIWPAVDRSLGRPISRVVQGFFGCGVGRCHRKIRWRLPFLASTFLRLTVRIGLALISQGTVKEASNLIFASSGWSKPVTPVWQLAFARILEAIPLRS